MVKVLAVVQWTLLALIFPVIIISGFMQETGWNPEWAPSFLGRDGGGIIGCIACLNGAFIVWMIKRYIDLYVATPLWVGTTECEELLKRIK